jgi:hypothetical protein
MDIIGFDNQMNGWFDKINPFRKAVDKGLTDAQKRHVEEFVRKKKSQKAVKKSNFGNLTSDQKKRMITSLVNSMNGVDEITGFEDQVGGFASMIKRYKKSIQPGSQIRLVKRTTPNRIKTIELAKRKINAQKIADRKVAEVIQARANQLISKKKPTVKDIFTAKPTPKLVNSLNAVQRSFLRTDLPYQNPSYQFAIEPAVDRGVVNYYGK